MIVGGREAAIEGHTVQFRHHRQNTLTGTARLPTRVKHTDTRMLNDSYDETIVLCPVSKCTPVLLNTEILSELAKENSRIQCCIATPNVNQAECGPSFPFG